MKNIKLFEEFITERSDYHAKTPADLKQRARAFKKYAYDIMLNNDYNDGYDTKEIVDAEYKFITDYLGTDQIVELAGGDVWADMPDSPTDELTNRFHELEDSIKNKKYHEMESGAEYMTGIINGAKVIGRTSHWTNLNKILMLSIKDINKFNVGTDPFYKE